jgi:hypothetical protein
MRYLYGDSVPFPPQYDLLAAVKIFIDQATIAARMDAEGRTALETVDAEAVNRARAAESLESAHVAVMHALGAATTGGQPLIVDYARRVQDFAAAIVVATKQDAGGEAQRARDAARAKAEQARTVTRKCLETILVAMRLPVSESRIVMEIEGQTNDFQTAFVHGGGIATSFALSVDMLPDWQKPRRISDFAQAVTLPVGLKRSLFKRTLTYEPVTLDDFFIGGFDLEDGAVELKLRRKPNEPDVLVFKLSETDSGYSAVVEHPGESGAEGLEPVLDPGSTKELERFITLLRSACGPVVAHKSNLLGVTLNGQDVFDDGLVPQLLSVIVQRLAPTVAEISRRSASPVELTLKTEDDEGKRQEVYVKKAELFAKLETVPPASRAIFEPLRAALEARPETPPPPIAR